MAKVTLRRLDDKNHFLGTNESGNTLHFDTDPPEGNGQGVGPMQAVAMAIGGCSGIDIVDILRKGRQKLDGFDASIEYEREGTPALFTHIHVHYALTGDLHPGKVRRAVDLSINKYCSVAKIVEKTAAITVSYSLNGTRYEL